MPALRIPFAAASGALISAALFLGLWHLVSQPIEWRVATEAPRIDFTPKIVETPPESKRDPKIVHEPPKGVPETPRIDVDGGTDVRTVAPPTGLLDIDLRGPGLRLGSDRDVTPMVRIAPAYPPSAETRGIEGWVQVQFTITAAGTVRDAVVVAAEPPNVFDKAALEAIARWRYNPRVDGGVAVERVGVQTLIRFNLE
jgi:protein TonB